MSTVRWSKENQIFCCSCSPYRDHRRLFTLKKQLDGLGVGMFAIVRENIPEQIEQFRTGFWPDADILLDETDALYKAIGGGEKRCD